MSNNKSIELLGNLWFCLFQNKKDLKYHLLKSVSKLRIMDSDKKYFFVKRKYVFVIIRSNKQLKISHLHIHNALHAHLIIRRITAKTLCDQHLNPYCELECD